MFCHCQSASRITIRPGISGEAGIESLEHGRTKYTANSGMRELREECCSYLKRRFNLSYSEDEILITVGGQ